MLKDHCHCCAIPKEWGGHHDNCLYDKAADEIERLREILRVMSDHVLAVREEIRQFRTITGNYMRNDNEVAGEKVRGYVNSEIIPEELWLLALTYRTQHAGNYDDYAERRQNL